MNENKVLKFLIEKRKREKSDETNIYIDDSNTDYTLIGNKFLFFRVDKMDQKKVQKSFLDAGRTYKNLYEENIRKYANLEYDREITFPQEKLKVLVFKNGKNETWVDKRFCELVDLEKVELRQEKDNNLNVVEVLEDDIVVAAICTLKPRSEDTLKKEKGSC